MSALATIGVLSDPLSMTMAAGSKSKLKKFGFIGFLREEMEIDWKGTLKKVVELGYSEWQTGTMYGASPREFLNYCKEIGIKPVSGTAQMKQLMQEPQRYFDQCNELNYKYLMIGMPWLTGHPFMLEDCKRSAEMLNELGAKAKANEVILMWHNHDLEFIPMEEGLPFDYLMDHTEPSLVTCTLDIFWVQKGWADPLKVLKKYAGRIPMLHVKDITRWPSRDFACPGSGIIDFGPIFAEAEKQGIEHYIVERDNCTDPWGCLTSSAEYLKNLEF